MADAPIVKNYDKKTHKKCIKCRQWKSREDDYGKHELAADGLQSICKACKNLMNKSAREKNVTARLRHHIATRCATQLGDLTPSGFTSDLEDYLGYRIRALVKHLSRDLKEREGKDRKLRDALNEGYHVDHRRPLSSFEVVYMDKHADWHVDWEAFKECWAIENLTAIPAAENLAKGATWDSSEAEGKRDDARDSLSSRA